MLHENLTVRGSSVVEDALSENEGIYRYCTFESASLEGGTFDGVFLYCTFRDIEWYWGLFNLALLIGCKFERCSFRGTTFADCRFVDCTFTDCHFQEDNLRSQCCAPESKFFSCSANNCEGWNEILTTSAP